MTKSLQSATKLRLSRIIRCLVALGCIKLAIMGVALLDLPMPAWLSSDKDTPTQLAATGVQEYSAPVSGESVVAEAHPKEELPPLAEALPTGAAAAELAAASRPRNLNSNAQPALPAPLVSANRISPLASEGAAFIAPTLPEPPVLDAPLARAGVIIPEPSKAQKNGEESIWAMLDIKSLPIPGLGSAKAAHAAAADMPVPQTPMQPSPFAPAEQLAPTGAQSVVLPGAPPLPANLPNGQDVNGAPLPYRQGNPNPGQNNMYQPMPGQTPDFEAPAPNIPPAPESLDPNSQAQELARQQQDILMLRQQMDQRMKDLQNAEDKMKNMLQEAKNLEEKKVKSLVQMYANMKPRMAAQALENMDERVAVRILSRMAPKQSGEILTYTNPAKTAKFSEMMTKMRLSD